MKPQFFDIADLKSKPLAFWSDRLEHGSDGFFGCLYFSCDGRKFRVAFSFSFGVFEAGIFYFRSRQAFNKCFALSFRELVDKVFGLLDD